MQERLKQIPKRLLEFWNKFNNKQKTIIVCVALAVLMSLTLLYVVITKPTYKFLVTGETQKDASEIVGILKKEGISYNVSSDNLTINVEEKDYTDAVMKLGENDIPAAGYTYEEAFSSDMSTTESEKDKKYKLAFESQITANLLKMDGIKDASVNINQPMDDNTVLAEEKEASINAMLTLSEGKEYSTEEAANLASYLANLVGNETTDKVRIIDSNNNLLFSGASDSLLGGNVGSVLEYKSKLINNITNNVSEVLIKYGYKDVEVGSSNLILNMDKVSELYTEYTPAEGQEQGVYSNSYNYNATGTTGSGGVPGTDSNGDETTYNVQTSDSTGSETDISKYEYLPNERKINTEHEVGAVVPDKSSMAIVLTQFKTIKQEDLERQGLLTGTTWEDYVLQNDVRTKQEVDPEVYTLVSMTTGIAENQLQISAWEQPKFISKEVSSGAPIDWLMIALAVLIIALLIFVVFKGTAPVEVTELEPELSVEQLLATTKENQSLDDIEFNEKSETRKMIEKFVDENPEAVAQLLRNWLNEEWG